MDGKECKVLVFSTKTGDYEVANEFTITEKGEIWSHNPEKEVKNA
jgi:hypothetical protein